MSGRLLQVLAWVAAEADPAERAKLARYGIPDGNAVGIPMNRLLAQARALGRDTGLARALWASGGYEARTLAAMIADPATLTPAEMDGWVADFDSWAICDTVAFRLFDRSPHVWDRIVAWEADPRPMVRRAAYASLWALALHDRQAGDAPFLEALDRLAGAGPETEQIVEKAQIMAVGAIARRGEGLRDAVRELGARLAADPARRRLSRTAQRV